MVKNLPAVWQLVCLLKVTSVLSDSATVWTVALQAPLSMGFSRQEYWSGFPCPLAGDLPISGIEPRSPEAPELQSDSLPLSRNVGDLGSIPGSGRAPGKGNGNPVHPLSLPGELHGQRTWSMGLQRLRCD